MPPRIRHEGSATQGLGSLRRMMPYLMPSRNEAFVLFSQQIRAQPGAAFLEQFNRRRPLERRATQFHLVLRAITFALHEFPRLNRFVVGGRHYDRRGIWIGFSAKTRLDLDAPVFARKMRFFPDESFGEMVDRIHALVGEGRSGRSSSSDREVDLILRLPGPLRRLVIRAGRWLDAMSLLPRSMVENDPLYASAFAANLGSVGLDAAYHHLFEHGTTPVFVTMGRVHRAPLVAEDGSIAATEIYVLKYTFDERTEDGFYAARGLERLAHLLEHPEEMAQAVELEEADLEADERAGPDLP